MHVLVDLDSELTPFIWVFWYDGHGNSAWGIPSASTLRPGLELSSKHDSNTWHHGSETRPQISIHVSTNKAKSCSKAGTRPRPRPSSYSAPVSPLSSCSPYTPKLMNEEDSPSLSTDRTSIAQASSHRESAALESNPKPNIDWRGLKRARKRVTHLRDGLFRQRLWLKEKRNLLQEERSNVAETEADLTSFIRQNFSERIPSEPSLAQSLYAELESKRAALEAKRDELGALQYDYDQAELDHNLKESELDEEEQQFETFVFEALGVSESEEEDEESSASSSLIQNFQRNAIQSSPDVDSDQAQLRTNQFRTQSDSALANIQRSIPKVGPRVNWWILHTFGCSPIDYVQRAQYQSTHEGLDTTNDETWARLIFDYWRREKEPESNAEESDESWADSPIQKMPHRRHIRRCTIEGTYLVLSSELLKAQHTVNNYDALFPADSGAKETILLQDGFASQSPNSPPQYSRSVSPVSAPDALGSLDLLL